ncbi:hypothetical protein EDE12_11211 [Methylosinus sp. sav-2]|nr:hypothetical protein EDE12_11211 [Methylosinus sp. sav-2]
MRDMFGSIAALPFVVLVVIIAAGFCIVERACAARRPR